MRESMEGVRRMLSLPTVADTVVFVSRGLRTVELAQGSPLGQASGRFGARE